MLGFRNTNSNLEESKNDKNAPSNKPMSQDKDLIDYLLLLRYGPYDDMNKRKPALSLSAIAKVS